MHLETYDLCDVPNYFGVTRNWIIKKVLVNILVKDLIVMIEKYDFNFSIQQKIVLTTKPLISYKKEIWLLDFLEYSIHSHINLLHPLLETKELLPLEHRFLIHDGWDKYSKEDCYFKKEAQFDFFQDSYIEHPPYWEINNQIVCRPCLGEDVIFKRNNKFYTKKTDYLFLSENGHDWKRYSLPYSNFSWDQWAIFLSDILVMLEIEDVKDKKELTLLFGDLQHNTNTISIFFKIHLGQTTYKALAWTSLLATQYDIHIITEIECKPTYFKIKF